LAAWSGIVVPPPTGQVEKESRTEKLAASPFPSVSKLIMAPLGLCFPRDIDGVTLNRIRALLMPGP
jgi:hypothetical protein